MKVVFVAFVLYACLLQVQATRLPREDTESDEENEVSTIVSNLHLYQIPHVEGGYFLETYRSGAVPGASMGLTDLNGDLIPTNRTPPTGQRNIMTSIYYLLTTADPINYWHRNKSDMIRYHHSGDALNGYLIDTVGNLSTYKLGSATEEDEKPQVVIPGGYWEAMELTSGSKGYILQGNVVAPGFDYRDMELADSSLATTYPELSEVINRYMKPATR